MTIDWWTLGIQTINIVILIWLLRHFFWRPVATMIAQRKDSAQKTLDDAAAKNKLAVAAAVDIEKTRAGFAKEREAILAEAQKIADQIKDASHQESVKDAGALKAAAAAAIESEKVKSGKAWTDHAGQLAVEIAQKLIARLDSPAIRAGFLEWLLEQIKGQPEHIRKTMTANGVTLELTSVAPLDPADQEHCGNLIGEACGRHVPITFKVDPSLIGGLELGGPHLVISNSWRADLAQILSDITRDNRH